VLVTGAARRGGAAISRAVHARGRDVIVHCRAAALQEAQQLCDGLNRIRPDSALAWVQDLDRHVAAPPRLASIVGLVANASHYAASALDTYDEHIDADLAAHLDGHLALIRHCRPALARHHGAIVAVTDIHVARPARGYLAYQVAKGALDTAVRALAVDLAPAIRVNAVAPGALDWPAAAPIDAQRQARILASTPLGRLGTFAELAGAVCFLLFDATFTTGATLTVDGGRSVSLA
jgi:pteridine reductase